MRSARSIHSRDQIPGSHAGSCAPADVMESRTGGGGAYSEQLCAVRSAEMRMGLDSRAITRCSVALRVACSIWARCLESNQRQRSCRRNPWCIGRCTGTVSAPSAHMKIVAPACGAERTERAAAKGRAFVGISGYDYKPWRGRFYPRGAAGPPMAGVRQPSLQYHRAQRDVLQPEISIGLSTLGRGSARSRLHVRDQGWTIHHAQSEASPFRNGTRQFLRERSARARRSHGFVSLATARHVLVRCGTTGQLHATASAQCPRR